MSPPEIVGPQSRGDNVELADLLAGDADTDPSHKVSSDVLQILEKYEVSRQEPPEPLDKRPPEKGAILIDGLHI